MVKPEFFDSESLGDCSIAARLAFIGLWVTGDDYGNQRAQVRRLKLKIFPYDDMSDDDFLGLLCELEACGCVKGYIVDDELYVNVPNFETYQTVRKPSKSNIPEPPKSTGKQRRTTVIHQWRTGDVPVTHYDGSTTPVTHYDDTSDAKERSKEGSNRVLTDSIANEKDASDGAAVAEATPPAADGSKVPSCPLCSQRLRFDPSALSWTCDLCGDVKEPVFREAVA